MTVPCNLGWLKGQGSRVLQKFCGAKLMRSGSLRAGERRLRVLDWAFWGKRANVYQGKPKKEKAKADAFA
jgi:hypothetical protein